MSAPAIILSKGFILIADAQSYLSITSTDNKTLFGIIALVYSGCGYLSAGVSVAFDVTKAVSLLYGSTRYYMVHEDFVTGNEGTPPP